MITQTITASMTQTSLSKILTRRYDVGREIKFILYKDELLSDPIDLTDYTVVITVIKPDNNFVIENFNGDTVTITDQMEVVTGTGYYCVHVTKGTETIYTGQGEFIIDDVLISDEELESISEVNGLKFPDDFITVEDHVAVIDDTVTTTEKTWSSSKISDEIENISVVVSKTAEGNPITFDDAADAPLVKCVTQITGYQEGSGTPSPDNIRPIVAYTEGEIEVSDGDGNTTTHTATFSHSIYQGNADFVGGSVEYDWVKKSNISFTGVTKQGNNYRFEVPLQSTGDGICSHFPADIRVVSNPASISFDAIWAWAGGRLFFISTPNGTNLKTVNEANTYFSNNNIEIAYKLAPTTSPITPTNLPIKSLLGYNHIESTTGDMEIEYITQDYQPLVESIVMESERKITKLWDAGFTPSPGVWLEYDFGEDLENYDAIVILFVVSGWEGNNADSVTVYPKIQQLNTNKYYHYIKGTEYGIQFWRVSGTTYGLGSIDGNYPPQYKAVYGIKY